MFSGGRGRAARVTGLRQDGGSPSRQDAGDGTEVTPTEPAEGWGEEGRAGGPGSGGSRDTGLAPAQFERSRGTQVARQGGSGHEREVQRGTCKVHSWDGGELKRSVPAGPGTANCQGQEVAEGGPSYRARQRDSRETALPAAAPNCPLLLPGVRTASTPWQRPQAACPERSITAPHQVPQGRRPLPSKQASYSQRHPEASPHSLPCEHLPTVQS